MSIELDRVYNEDNLATLDRMEDGLIDITITSPPYNVDLGNNKYNKFSYDRYCDAIGHNEYMANMENVFSKVYAKTKSGGKVLHQHRRRQERAHTNALRLHPDGQLPTG